MLLILAPVAVIPLQGYGGEAPLRGYLFALPWLAFLAAGAVPAGRADLARPAAGCGSSSPARRSPRPCCSRTSGWRRSTASRRRTSPAAAWIDANAPEGTLVTFLAPSFPARPTAGYARLTLQTSPTTPNLLETATRAAALGPARAETLGELQEQNPAPAHYVVVSQSQSDYLELYGFTGRGSVPAMTRLLEASPDYELVYRRGDASVFRWLG